MWKKSRQFLNRLALGALIGFGLWSLIGSWFTSLLFGSVGGSFSCKADVELALGRYISMQMYSALGGALVFVVAAWFVRRALDKRKAKSAPVDPPDLAQLEAGERENSA